jgi:hypothetical protein
VPGGSTRLYRPALILPSGEAVEGLYTGWHIVDMGCPDADLNLDIKSFRSSADTLWLAGYLVWSF